MVELSEQENDKLNQGICPDCGGNEILEGPCGGGAMNVRCAKCGEEYWFAPPFTARRLERNAPDLYRGPISRDTFVVAQQFSKQYTQKKPWWRFW